MLGNFTLSKDLSHSIIRWKILQMRRNIALKMAVLYVVRAFYNYLHSSSFDGKTYTSIFTEMFKLENDSMQLGSVTKADVPYAPFQV